MGRIITPSKKIFTNTLHSQDVVMNWNNSISRGLVMFMIPGDNMNSLIDISRPWVSKLSTNTTTSRKEISSAFTLLLPPFESAIFEYTTLLFSSIPDVFGYNAFIGGANSSGEASLGISAEVGGRQLATLFGGVFWAESGYIPADNGESDKLGSMVGMSIGSSTGGRFYVNGRFVGSHGNGPGASSTRFGLGSDASLSNGTTISNIAAIMVWNRVLTDNEVVSIYSNRFQLLKPRPLKIFVSIGFINSIRKNTVNNSKALRGLKAIRFN